MGLYEHQDLGVDISFDSLNLFSFAVSRSVSFLERESTDLFSQSKTLSYYYLIVISRVSSILGKGKDRISFTHSFQRQSSL